MKKTKGKMGLVGSLPLAFSFFPLASDIIQKKMTPHTGQTKGMLYKCEWK